MSQLSFNTEVPYKDTEVSYKDPGVPYKDPKASYKDPKASYKDPGVPCLDTKVSYKDPKLPGFKIHASFLGKNVVLCNTKRLFSDTLNSLCVGVDLAYPDLQLQSALSGFGFVIPIVNLTK